MTSIHTLVPDIYQLIKEKPTGWFNEQLAQALSIDLAKRLQGQLGEPRKRPRLRLSAMGPRCPKALWLSIHNPELGEPIPPWAEIKFSYGHILEAFLVTLAKASGHEVTGEGDELKLDDIVGHRDCVIDGCTVDVKSASSLSFQKFKSVDYSLVDNFGYLDQLDGYVVAALDDPLVRVKDKGYLLACDKTLGHLHVYEHVVRPSSIRARIAQYKAITSLHRPPACTCTVEPIGAAGNTKLGLKASYSPYKWECFPTLRAFKYAGGIIYLSKTVRKPDVPEIDRYGRTVYN